MRVIEVKMLPRLETTVSNKHVKKKTFLFSIKCNRSYLIKNNT